MSDNLDKLLRSRNEALNRIIGAAIKGSAVEIISATQEVCDDLISIDDQIREAHDSGEDFREFLKTVPISESFDTSDSVSQYVQKVRESLKEHNYKTSITQRDRTRAEGILDAKPPRSPEGKASGMVSNTQNKEKLYSRGMVLLELGRPDLARLFLQKVGDSFGLGRLPSIAWDGPDEVALGEKGNAHAFNWTDDEKIEALNGLLLKARSLASRKAEKENSETLKEEALLSLLALLGVETLKTHYAEKS